MTCKVHNCDRQVVARALCGKHWQQWRKTADIIPDKPAHYAQTYLRDVVLTHDSEECLIWPFAKNNVGYARVRSGGRLRLTSRVVCEAVHGPPPTPTHEAAHSCGNGHLGCVAKRHLSWKTPPENSFDKVGHGRGSGKLSPDLAMEIRRQPETISNADLAAKYGVSRTTIRQVRTRQIWGWTA